MVGYLFISLFTPPGTDRCRKGLQAIPGTRVLVHSMRRLRLEVSYPPQKVVRPDDAISSGEIARQGKVGELISKGGLKSDGHNLPIGLKSGPVGSTIQIAK